MICTWGFGVRIVFGIRLIPRLFYLWVSIAVVKDFVLSHTQTRSSALLHISVSPGYLTQINSSLVWGVKYSLLATHHRASQRLGCKYSHPQNRTYTIDWCLQWQIRIEQFHRDWHLVTLFFFFLLGDPSDIRNVGEICVGFCRVLEATPHNYPVHFCSKSFYHFIKLIDVNPDPSVSNVHSLACNYSESKMPSFRLCPTLVNHGCSLHCWTSTLNHNPLTASVLCVA